MVGLRNIKRYGFTACLIFIGAAVCLPAEELWNFACQADNDLLRVMQENGFQCQRFDSPEQAVQRAGEKSVVFILADGYPFSKTQVHDSLWSEAEKKGIKLFVEYPESIPNLTIGDDHTTKWERGVIASEDFGASLPPMSILAIHDCHYYDVNVKNGMIAVARVAGFDRAVYGLPENSAPVLFKHPQQEAWIAATQLSQFVTARYSPYKSWQSVWKTILSDLSGQDIPVLEWEQDVRPTYPKRREIPGQAEQIAFQRGADWFVHSRLLVDSSDEERIANHLEQGYTDPQHYAAGWMNSEARPLPNNLPIGDGSHGFLEGYSAQILYNGTQMQRLIRRSDCISEAAMGLAFGGDIQAQPRYPYFTYAENLLDYVYYDSSAQQGVRNDPSHPAFGLIAWGVTNWAWEKATYGDDMARVMLATAAAAGLMKSDRWDEGILKCLLGSLRTTGALGFRHNRIDIPNLEQNGWRHYFEESITSVAPHYQAYLWACYLWAYHQTGYKPFLDKAKTAIQITMECYPDGWRWTNGIQQERARMLLPLAWLVRIEDTPEHRAWLKAMANELLALQDESGALREELGDLNKGSMRPPQSNEAYGTGETPLIQQNGDAVCDLLYTSNFAFLGLHEAASATGDPYYKNACDQLAEFLCRIQIFSQRQKELDGGWFRAFDFNRWEYWASNADAGWGAWCIESGWTQGWIVAVLGLRSKNTSLWDVMESSEIEKHFSKLQPVFFRGGDQPPKPKMIDHAAKGKSIQLRTEYSPSYSARGKKALVDGFLAEDVFPDSSWQGYLGDDVEAVVDLGKAIELKEIKLRCLQQVDVGIFLPERVEISISPDGDHFQKIRTLTHDVSRRSEGPLAHAFSASLENKTARYVLIQAKNLGMMPEWHRAHGRKSWLFVDEIIINPEEGSGE